MKKCMYISLEVSGNTVCFSFDPLCTELFVDSFFFNCKENWKDVLWSWLPLCLLWVISK